MSSLIWLEIIIPILFISIELVASAKTRWKHYDWMECWSSIAIRIIVYVLTASYAVLLSPLFEYAWKIRVFELKLDVVSQFFVFFLATEFLYYVSHVFAHKVSIGWANHAPHHTLQKFNMINGLRVGATGPFALYAFFPLVLVWLGFHPVPLKFYMFLGFCFQLLQHTETINKLGFLEGIINTPSSHRVHHGIQSIYVDKNFGGVLLIFDRLFGTYQKELDDVRPIYGLAGETIPNQNPVRLLLIGWEIILRNWLKSFFFLIGTIKNKIAISAKLVG